MCALALPLGCRWAMAVTSPALPQIVFALTFGACRLLVGPFITFGTIFCPTSSNIVKVRLFCLVPAAARQLLKRVAGRSGAQASRL